MSTGPLILAGLFYALGFWALALWRPRIALMLIFASAPFQNDISGGGPVKFSLAEVNLLLSLPVLLLRAKRLRFGPTLWPALAYMAVCILSLLGQWRGSSLTSLVQVAIYTVVVVLVFASLARSVEDYRPAFVGLIVVAVVLAVLVCVNRTPYILGLHKNGIGATLAVSLVIALELWLGAAGRKWQWLYLSACGILAIGSMLTLSRGAWLSAIVGVLVILLLRRRFSLVFKMGAVMTPLVALGWTLLPQESRDYATGFEEERWNIQLRYASIDFAWSQFMENPIQGVGIGLRKEYDATNVVLMTLAETGVQGLVAFLAIHGVVLVMVWRVYRRTSSRSFEASILAIALALVMGKLAHGMVDHYWSRGSLTVVWASVGMATFVGHQQRILRKRAARARAFAVQERFGSVEPVTLAHSNPIVEI